MRTVVAAVVTPKAGFIGVSGIVAAFWGHDTLKERLAIAASTTSRSGRAIAGGASAPVPEMESKGAERKGSMPFASVSCPERQRSEKLMSPPRLRRFFDTSPLVLNAVCNGRTLRNDTDVLGVLVPCVAGIGATPCLGGDPV